MLSKPKGGWSDITIGNWSDRCSYLDDVPFQLLKAIERVCKKEGIGSVKFDAEGWEYIIVFDLFNTHIISDKLDEDEGIFYSVEGFNYFSIDTDYRELAKELISDIRRDVDGWSTWFSYRDMSEDEISERKENLLILCEMIEKKID